MLAWFLRDSVMLRCASSCSAVDKQRTSGKRGCLNSATYSRQNLNFDSAASFEPGGQEFESLRRCAGLDVAASAAAVRSEAEDERRSREQSVRTLYSNLVESTN
jgi:hypothetical protein